MTETPEEFRRRVEDLDAKFYEQVIRRGEPHRSRSFEYEKLAVEYSHRGLQLLTYLSGGALVAIPTALAFFKADVGRADVLADGGDFHCRVVFCGARATRGLLHDGKASGSFYVLFFRTVSKDRCASVSSSIT